MKHTISICLCLILNVSLWAQSDLNLLDLVEDDSTAVAPTEEKKAASTATKDDFNWQEHRHNLMVSLGAPSLLAYPFTSLTFLLTKGEAKTTFTGSVGVEYDYNALKWLRVGGRLGYQGIFVHGYESPQINKVHMLTIGGRLDFTYLNRRKLRLYSGLELGASFCFSKSKTQDGNKLFIPWFDAGIIPFGLQAGGEHVYFMSELSIGTVECCRVGLGYRF